MDKGKNDRIMSESLRDQCVIGGLTPYWLDLSEGIKMQKTILIGIPIPAKEIDFQDIKQGQTIYLQGKMAPMEKAGQAIVEPTKMMVDVREIYAKDGVLMIETGDGKLLCSHDFSQEWQKVLDRQKDMAIVRLAQQAFQEKGDLYRPATLALLRAMGTDFKALDFPEHCWCHKRLRHVSNEIHAFMQHNMQGPYPSPEYIEQLKAVITKAVEDPIKQQQMAIVQNVFEHCATEQKPLVYAQDITVLNSSSRRHLPVSLDELERGEAVILTKESPMHSIQSETSEVSREGAQIENVFHVDGGYLIICPDVVISTLDCHEQWQEYLQTKVPEKYAAIILADTLGKQPSEITIQDLRNLPLTHSWLDGMTEVQADTIQRPVGYDQLSPQTPVGSELAQYIEQKQAVEAFYEECISKGVDAGMSFVNIETEPAFYLVTPAGLREEIDKTEIRPGMTIAIDNNPPCLVEDCQMVNGELLVVSHDTIFAEIDIEYVAKYYVEQYRPEKEAAERAENEPTQTDPEIQGPTIV